MLARCAPSVGVAELVWNSLDADASDVRVRLTEGALGGVGRVVVEDNGTGIDITSVDDSFGKLGWSWKRTARTTHGGRMLHGRHGRGRFRSGSVGRLWRWDTVNKDVTGQVHRFAVSISADDPKDVQISDSVKLSQSHKTGTTVTIDDVSAPTSKHLEADYLRDRLAETFASYLLQNRDVKISVDRQLVDPAPLITDRRTFELPAVTLADGRTVRAQLTVVEWKRAEERRIFLCDARGVSLAEVPLRSHLLEGHVTAYLSSDHFRQLNIHDLPDSIEQMEEVQPFLKAAREQIKHYIRERMAQKAQDAVKRWKEENIYPFEGDPETAVETVERQVFDIVAGNVDQFLPKFRTASVPIKRLQFQFLKVAIEAQPEELVQFLEQAVQLPQDQLRDLQELLQRTSLSTVIKAAKLVDLASLPCT
jgi:hypothetical protein